MSCPECRRAARHASGVGDRPADDERLARLGLQLLGGYAPSGRRCQELGRAEGPGERLRRECLDRLLILGRRHLERVVRVYAKYYNEHRPHRSLDQPPPLAKPPPIDEPAPTEVLPQLDRLRRRDRLAGLLHEYELAA
jgi:hypothetical protein